MTPAARVSGAIEVLEQVLSGISPAQALKVWARGNRYAGSKDRRAIQDYVFKALRCRSSLSGGAEHPTARALMIGLLNAEDSPLEEIFCDARFAPSPLTQDEQDKLAAPPEQTLHVCLDIPQWLWPIWERSLGDQAIATAKIQQERAPVYLRINTQKTTRQDAQTVLLQESIETQEHPLVSTCLRILSQQGRITHSAPYIEGSVELQDAASQWAIAQLDTLTPHRILDYCAGGGGKTLAVGDLHPQASLTAYDVNKNRMKDLPERAKRAGLSVEIVEDIDQLSANTYDLVLCDAPCSGSGTWRRNPFAKWMLTQEALQGYTVMQYEALEMAAKHTADDGVLVYMTCSVLDLENANIIKRFQHNHPDWTLEKQDTLHPNDLHDGFYVAHLHK